MSIDPAADIHLGIPVYTEEGQQLGLVKEVTPAAIKVDAPLRPDYWISREQVLSFMAGRVTLDFTVDQLEHHASTAPLNRERST